MQALDKRYEGKIQVVMREDARDLVWGCIGEEMG